MDTDGITATEDALRSLEEHGSDLSKPMVIDFFVAIPDESRGKLVAEEASKHGFTVSIEQDEKSAKWTCYCSMEMIPNIQKVIQVEELLETIAARHGGNADGFGSFGNGE